MVKKTVKVNLKPLKKDREWLFYNAKKLKRAIEGKELYRFLTAEDPTLNARFIDLFSRDILRFRGKTILFDDGNAALSIDDSGQPFLELSLDKTGRHMIPMNLQYNKYYHHLLLHCLEKKEQQNFFGSILFVNSQLGWQTSPIIAYFVVDAEEKWNPNFKETAFVGVDVNLYYPTWFAIVDGDKKVLEVGKFPTYTYNLAIERLQQQITDIQRTEGYNDKCDKLNHRIQMIAKNKWGEFISDIEKVLPVGRNVVFCVEDPKRLYKFQLPKNKKLRSILMQKWHMGMLPAMLASKGYKVIDVNPSGTSKRCHICGTVNKTLGGSRSFTCTSKKRCLTNYNRDLNAALNIAFGGKAMHDKWVESIKAEASQPIQPAPPLSVEPPKVA